jgi:hypothetical protein
MKNYEMIEHAVFMGWKTVLCTILEIAIFWDVMLCSRVDRCKFVASVFMVVQEEPYSFIRKSKWKKLL